MTYKSIIDQRKQAKRWRLAHPDRVRFRRDIGRIARKANPIRKPCSVVGCRELGERHHPDYSKPKEIIWLCKKHHELEHHSKTIVCSVEGCGRKNLAKGLCHVHYYKKFHYCKECGEKCERNRCDKCVKHPRFQYGVEGIRSF